MKKGAGIPFGFRRPCFSYRYYYTALLSFCQACFAGKFYVPCKNTFKTIDMTLSLQYNDSKTANAQALQIDIVWVDFWSGRGRKLQKAYCIMRRNMI